MRSTGWKFLLLGVVVGLSTTPCIAQHVDVLLDAVDGRLTIVAPINGANARESDVFGDGSVYRTDDPGYATVGFGTLAAGDEIFFDLLTPLYHWSGDNWALASDDTYLRFYDPTLPEVNSVVATRTSGEAEGFLLQRATVLGSIHVHNIFELGSETDSPVPVGAYAIGKRLTSPQYEDSEEFIIVLNNGLEEATFDESLLAAELAFLPIAGDFDGDRDVDGHDFLTWQRDPAFGSLTDWQDGYANGNANAVVSVPEPVGLVIAMTTVLVACCCRRHPRAITFAVVVGATTAHGAASHAAHLDIMLYQADGELQLGGYDFGRLEPVFGIQVFQESTNVNPAAPGVARVNNPGWAAVPSVQLDRLPPGAELLPAGAAVSFDIVPFATTGTNLSYWNGSLPVSFDSPLAGETVVYGGGLFDTGAVVDGTSSTVEGFEFTTTGPTGYLHSHQLFSIFGNSDRQTNSNDGPEPGVYLLEIVPRVAGLAGDPSAYVLIAVDVDDDVLTTAGDWVSSQVVPEPSSMVVAVLGLPLLRFVDTHPRQRYRATHTIVSARNRIYVGQWIA